jgi:ribonucleotide reductase alpha subunit
MQRICQRHLDNACSKTINVLPGTSAEELSDLYMEFLPELKGLTVYPEGSREDQPLTPLSYEEALEFAQDAETAVDGGKCRSGVCDI